MLDAYRGVDILLEELQRKANAISLFYRKENTEPLDTARDWPRDAEIELIEALVLQKTEEVTGTSEILGTRWQRCIPFARRIAAPWLHKEKQPDETVSESQRAFDVGQSKIHEGIALWTKHTSDYLKFLRASDSGDLGRLAKKTILFLAASPADKAQLFIEKEVREIRDELERAKLRDTFVLEPRGAVRPKDFVRNILDLSPAYVHFSGHGTKSGSICMEDDAGNTKELKPDAVASIFEASGKNVECVVMNSCFSEAQAHAIHAYVPHVIGTIAEIDDDVAISFSRGFYRALAAGLKVSRAYRLGLAEIKIDSLPSDQVPILLGLKQDE